MTDVVFVPGTEQTLVKVSVTNNFSSEPQVIRVITPGPQGTRGTRGIDGLAGPAGIQGRDLMLRVEGTLLQTKYVDEVIWNTLIDLSTLYTQVPTDIDCGELTWTPSAGPTDFIFTNQSYSPDPNFVF